MFENKSCFSWNVRSNDMDIGLLSPQFCIKSRGFWPRLSVFLGYLASCRFVFGAGVPKRDRNIHGRRTWEHEDNDSESDREEANSDEEADDTDRYWLDCIFELWKWWWLKHSKFVSLVFLTSFVHNMCMIYKYTKVKNDYFTAQQFESFGMSMGQEWVI